MVTVPEPNPKYFSNAQTQPYPADPAYSVTIVRICWDTQSSNHFIVSFHDMTYNFKQYFEFAMPLLPKVLVAQHLFQEDLGHQKYIYDIWEWSIDQVDQEHQNDTYL